MEPFTIEVFGISLQQDYILFLSALGWLLAGLIAWGNASAESHVKGLPWRWLGAFCFLRAIKSALEIISLVTFSKAPLQADIWIGLISYGCLLEFGRNSPYHTGQPRFSRILEFGGLALAAVIELASSDATIFSTGILATFAGLVAGISLVRLGRLSKRVLWWVAVPLFLLGPAEFISQRSLGFFFGVDPNSSEFAFVGIPNAILNITLSWMIAGGLWLGVILSRRRLSDLHSGQARLSRLSLWIFPSLLVGILAGGYFLVNWNAKRVRDNLKVDYLYWVKTAALSVDSDEVLALWNNGGDSTSVAYRKLQRQLTAIEEASADVRFVYLWTIKDGSVVYPVFGGHKNGVQEARLGLVKRRASAADLAAFRHSQPYFVGPVRDTEGHMLIANARIAHPGSGKTLAWLAMDIQADHWVSSHTNARLQTIAIIGLFSALVIFFLAHQILRESEAELLLAKQTAESADRAKSEFLAVMSHEIRTPLQSVLGYSELLGQTPISPVQRAYLETIRSQGSTLLRIVQDILDFSTLRKTSYALKGEPVYLHKLIEEIFQSIKPMADRKRLDYRLTVDSAVPELVRGDAVRLGQVLRNLLGNAVKFTPHGIVRLDVRLESMRRVRSSALGRFVFTISDTGIGISRDDIRRLCEPFTQLTSSLHVPRQGAGLGLAIVKRLCELMGGGIEIESETGRGSRFRAIVEMPVLLERIDEPAGSASEVVPIEKQETTNLAAVFPLRILVADDNPYIRNLLVEYLRMLGYKPKVASTGAEVVPHWREYDLLVMDLRMPEMDGVAAARMIRQQCANADRPWIIGVSATLAETEVERAIHAGMNDFLGKPFFVQSLREAIEAMPQIYPRLKDKSEMEAEPDDVIVDDIEPADDEAINGDDGDHVDEPSGDDESLSAYNWMPRPHIPRPGETVDENGQLVLDALEEIPKLIELMGKAIAENDFETVEDRSHYLKNTILALHLDPLFPPCRRLFELARSRQRTEAVQALGVLRSAYDTWKAEWEASDPI